MGSSEVQIVKRDGSFETFDIEKIKQAIRKAFENQKLKKGVSFVEIVSNCNSNWKMPATKANEWLEANMLPFYPLGDLKTPEK